MRYVTLEMKMAKLKSRPQNLQYMLREGITYTNISISSFGARYSPAGYIYDAAGSGIFCNDNQMIPYILAFLTSEVAAAFTKITSPTMSFEVGQIGSLPFIYKQSDMLDDLVFKNNKTFLMKIGMRLKHHGILLYIH